MKLPHLQIPDDLARACLAEFGISRRWYLLRIAMLWAAGKPVLTSIVQLAHGDTSNASLRERFSQMLAEASPPEKAE